MSLKNIIAAGEATRAALRAETKNDNMTLRHAIEELTLRGGRGGIATVPWGDTFNPDRETRDMTATGGTFLQQGGMTISRSVPDIGPSLRDALVLERLGANIITSEGDVRLPHGTAQIDAAWLAENANATDTDEELGGPLLKPKRIVATVPCSVQWLLQSPGAFDWLTRELSQALATEIERVALVGTGSSNQPRGILHTTGIGAVAGGTNGAAPTMTHLSELEEDVETGRRGFVTSPKVRRKLRLTNSAAAGSNPLWVFPDELLGYPAGVTSAIPDDLVKGSSGAVCSAIIFGDWSELYLCFFGGGIEIEIIRDPALAIAGKVQVQAGAFVDCVVRNPKAFTAMQDALAAV
jgi:HK97 family phage major capsid protein